MAKGYDKHMERVHAVSSFGKDLARRAKSKCELCETGNVSLKVYEVPPVTEEPQYEHCLFLCESCINLLERLDRAKEGDYRTVSNAIWNELPLVKALAVYLLRNASQKYYWAEEMVEDIYMEEETQEQLDRIDFSQK